MIHFEEKYTNRRGSVAYHTKSINYLEAIRSVDERYQAFLAEYIRAWLWFVREYQQDTDPERRYTSLDVHTLREKRLYPRIERPVVDAHKEASYGRVEEAELLYKMMRSIDDTMLERLDAHYKAHEYAEFPPGSRVEQPPFLLKGVYFVRNSDLLAEKQAASQAALVAPLILTWEYSEYSRSTRYTVFLPSGQGLMQSEWVKAKNRFKDPLKRHAAAIEQCSKLAALADWEAVERGISNAQKRKLHRVLLSQFREGWGA